MFLAMDLCLFNQPNQDDDLIQVGVVEEEEEKVEDISEETVEIETETIAWGEEGEVEEEEEEEEEVEEATSCVIIATNKAILQGTVQTRHQEVVMVGEDRMIENVLNVENKVI